jgi:succinoglycan biosynthesis transport protein ExoP
MLRQLENSLGGAASGAHADRSLVGSAISSAEIGALVRVLKRQRRLVLKVAAGTLGVALLFIVTSIPQYTAESDILVDTRNTSKILDERVAMTPNDLGLDTSSVDSQVEILKSEKIAVAVIKELGLAQDPQFSRPSNLIPRFAAGILDLLPSLGGTKAAEPDPQAPRKVVEGFLDRCDVKRVGLTYVLQVTFRSDDPFLSARIANAIAARYLNEQLQAKFEATQRASVWLQGRLAELKRAVNDAELLAYRYKVDNNIVVVDSTSNRLVTDQQVSEMTTQLSQLRPVTAQMEARYARIQEILSAGDATASVAEALDNQVVSRLREQYAQTAQREREWSKRYGSNHSAVVKLREEMDSLKKSLLAELTRIGATYRSDLEIAQSKTKDLERQVEALKAQASHVNEKQVTLRELEREATTFRTLYETYLERYKTALQQETFPLSDSRVLTMATPPRLKSHPKTALILILGGLAGLSIGAVIGLIRELSDQVFRAPPQIKSHLGVRCLGVIPAIASAPPTDFASGADPRSRNPAGSPQPLARLRCAVDEPMSRFAETLRTTKLFVDKGLGNGPVKVLGVISSTSGEGKSLVASNLAQLLAHMGNSVLLIDADLRSPSLSDSIAPMREFGLFEVLDSRVTLEQTVHTDPATKLEFLPASKSLSNPHTSDILGSEAMRRLIEATRRRYNYVILDLPPLLALVADVQAVQKQLDGFLFIIEWGRTPFQTASNALSSLGGEEAQLVGAVLNKADVTVLKDYSDDGGESYDCYPNDGYPKVAERPEFIATINNAVKTAATSVKERLSRPTRI